MNLPTDRDSQCASAVGGRCELEENLEVLRAVPVFSGIPLQQLKLYAYLAKRLCFREGEFLFHQGDFEDRGYILISGKVQVIRELADRSILLKEFSEGDFFGGLAMLSDVQRLFSVRAVTDTVCLSLGRESFHKLLSQFPEISVRIFDMMIKRIVEMEEKLLQAHMCECVCG